MASGERIVELATKLADTAADDVTGRTRLLVDLKDAVDLALAEAINQIDQNPEILFAEHARGGTDWLGARSDLHFAEIRNLVQLGSDLESMPATRRALDQGRISTVKAKALTAAATTSANFAAHETDLVERLEGVNMRRARQIIRRHILDHPKPDHGDALSPKTAFRLRQRGDGYWVPDGVLDPSTGSMFAAELRARADQYRSVPGIGADERNALGLGDMVRRSMTLGRPADTRPEIVVVAQVHEPSGELVEFETEGGEPVSGREFHKLGCDATIRRLLTNSKGDLLDLGRAERLASRAQRRALNFRDKHCTHPGCGVPAELCVAHHLHWWSRGGKTDMDNLTLRCQYHHSYAHDIGFTLVATPDTAVLHYPDGRKHDMLHRAQPAAA